jgi:hypothetical protein
MTTATVAPEAVTVAVWALDPADIPAAIEKLAKINARAARAGMPTRYTWTLGPERHEATPAEPGQPQCYQVLRDLTVTGDAPRLAGWAFLAQLTWDDGALITRCTPGFSGRIDEQAVRPGACEHCNVNRDRKDCYLLEHADGRRVQVGSTCVKDFLGLDFKPSWITYQDTLNVIRDDFPPSSTWSARAVTVLAYASAICAQTGWVSRDKAEETYCQSSGDVLRMILGGGKDRRSVEARQTYRPGPGHDAEAAAVLAWCQHLDPATESEYLANLRRAAEGEHVSYRNIPLIGSAVGAYQRDRARLAAELAAPDPAASQWFGKPGEKFAGLEVTCIDHRVIDGVYMSWKYTFAGEDGNRIEWWASNPQEGIEAGTRVVLSGTVNPKKAHDEYRGVKATRFTRCKWVAHPGEFAAMMAAHPGLAGLGETTRAERERMWVGGRQAADRLAAGLLLGEPADIAGWWTRWQAKNDEVPASGC